MWGRLDLSIGLGAAKDRNLLFPKELSQWFARSRGYAAAVCRQAGPFLSRVRGGPGFAVPGGRHGLCGIDARRRKALSILLTAGREQRRLLHGPCELLL
jgi:hypothetical protein